MVEAEQNNIALTGEAAFLDDLAAYLKNSFIYPSNNERVLESAALVCQGVKRHQHGSEPLRVYRQGTNYMIGHIEVAVEGVRVNWLRDCFSKAALGGVEFDAHINPESLGQFAELLRQNFSSGKRANFNSMWPKAYAGVRPMELVFAGSHDEEGLNSEAKAGVKLRGGGAEHGPATNDAVMQALTTSDELMGRLDSLQKRVSQDSTEDHSKTRLDILSQIRNSLPSETLSDHDMVRSIVSQVVDIAEKQIMELLETGVVGGEVEMSSLMASVGKKFFSSFQTAEHKDHHDEILPSGRPGDEKVLDDLQALLDEYHALPESPDLLLDLEQQGFAEEMLGIYLHHLVRCDEEEAVEFYEPIRSVLNTAKDPESIYQPYVEVCLSNKGTTERCRPYWRVIKYLQRAGFTEALQKMDYLRPELVAAVFPNQFVPFLDSLKAKDKVELEKISDVCYGVGPTKILSATDELTSGHGILSRRRVDKILSVDSPHVLPLAQVIAQHGEEWTRVPLVQFLKSMELPEAEAAAIRAIAPSELIPGPYLAEVCECVRNGKYPKKVRTASGEVVRQFIRDTEGDTKQLERRLYAISALRHLDSPTTMLFLKELSKAGGFFSKSKLTKPVRQAAKEVLNALQSARSK